MGSNGRTDLGRFAQGHPGGPGRSHTPRMAITNALRRLHDPDAIAAFLLGVIADASAPLRDRVAAAGMVTDRLEGKAPQHLAITATATALPAGWHAMSAVERVRYLDALEHQPRQLTEGDE